MPRTSILHLVKQGSFNFELFVQHMTTVGYITELNRIEGIAISSPVMEATHNEEIAVLYKLFYEGRTCPLSMDCIAVRDVEQQSGFHYAYYNQKLITQAEVETIVQRQVKQFLSD